MPITPPEPGALDRHLPGSVTTPYVLNDLAELVVLQRCCWVQEAILNDTLDVPALHETPEQVHDWATRWTTYLVRHRGRLVAGVRGRPEQKQWHVGRLMVAPDLAGRGIGSALLGLIERAVPTDIERYVLFTGGRSERNIRFYNRAGYTLAPPPPSAAGHIAGAVFMVKQRP